MIITLIPRTGDVDIHNNLNLNDGWLQVRMNTSRNKLGDLLVSDYAVVPMTPDFIAS